jgi:hypothetical protein
VTIRALVFSAIALAVPAAAFAQHTFPSNDGRVATVAPPPSRAPELPRTLVPGVVYSFGGTPVLMLDDGRVYADVGRGYERVVGTCESQRAYNGPVAPTAPGILQPIVLQPGVIQPTVAQPSIAVPQFVVYTTSLPAQPLPQTAPIPTEQTTPEQLSRQGVQPRFPTIIESGVCWNVGPNGPFFGRP